MAFCIWLALLPFQDIHLVAAGWQYSFAFIMCDSGVHIHQRMFSMGTRDLFLVLITQENAHHSPLAHVL